MQPRLPHRLRPRTLNPARATGATVRLTTLFWGENVANPLQWKGGKYLPAHLRSREMRDANCRLDEPGEPGFRCAVIVG